MLSSQDLPPYDKSPFRLALEMRTLVAAGTETTGNMLQATTFHLLKSPERVLRLKDEIRAAQSAASSPLRYTDLQRLPYLVSGTYSSPIQGFANIYQVCGRGRRSPVILTLLISLIAPQ